MALTREQRRAMLAQELDGGEVEVDATATVDAPPLAPHVPPAPLGAGTATEPPAVSGSAPLALTIEQLQAIVSAAVASAGGGGDVGAQISRALRDNRQPIPENTDAQYHGRSHYHPAGKEAPRPTLDHPLFLGIWDTTSGKAVARYPIDLAMSTDDEIVALNSIAPGTYQVKRNDGATTLARVVDIKDAMDTVIRRVIAFPLQQFEKEQRNTLPPLDVLASQLVA